MPLRPNLPASGPSNACISLSGACSTYQAVSARQIRVALDHFFSDVQLVTDTMNEFDPEKVKMRREQAAQTAVEAQGNQVEVGAT